MKDPAPSHNATSALATDNTRSQYLERRGQRMWNEGPCTVECCHVGKDATSARMYHVSATDGLFLGRDIKASGMRDPAPSHVSSCLMTKSCLLDPCQQ